MPTHGSNAAEFERDIIQALVMKMLSMQFVSSPQMNFLRTGNQLRDDYLYALLDDSGIKRMYPNDFKQYLLVLAYYALGAGAYITVKDAEGCYIEDLHCASAQEVRANIKRYGALDLGLKAICIDPQSQNKKAIDHLVCSSIGEIYDEYETELQDMSEYKIVLLRVFFNVGVTIALGRIDAA